jgi:rfaE bifunctional protein nucleotidyltransferase chain/domain
MLLRSMSMDKLKTPGDLANIRSEMHLRGAKMVFTNGCFDILHVGHVRYLQHARQLGDALIVALNGDESVRALKGEGRPINPETDRAEVLCALSCVDYVVMFHEARVTHLIRDIRPHIYVKGGDYTIDSLHPEELSTLRSLGIEVRILPLVPGKSTSAILNAWKS